MAEQLTNGVEAPLGGLLGRLGTYSALVKFEHTAFALPFAYAAALLAEGAVPSWPVLGYILVAMVGGRTAAMGANRLIDAAIDARNPRTRMRHLPRRLVRPAEVAGLTLVSLALLYWAAARLNALAVAWLPVIVPVLVLYPYAKRFTWLCHAWLGAAYFFVPFGAWIAVRAAIDLPAVVLGLAAGLWVAGFDIIYALQDLEFDRSAGVHSLPARFGPRTALRAAAGAHVLTVLLLVLGGVLAGAGPAYLVGLAAVAALLIYEHRLVAPLDLARIPSAFFTVNSLLSVVYLLAVLADLALR